MSAPNNYIEVIAEAIAKGYSFGPASSCRACHEKLIDFDSKSAGFCEQCLAMIETHKEAACSIA